MSDTVERNISLGSVKVDPDTVIWAGDITGVSTLTDKHPDGYKMKLSERERNLYLVAKGRLCLWQELL